MPRLSLLSAPFLLGFDAFEERIERLAKAADGYPPYNIERLPGAGSAEHYRIAIAVAGFSPADLEIISEDNQLVVRGRNAEEEPREFLHRGIATRQFQRSFLLADGMQVMGADLRDGMLMIDVERPEAKRAARRIEIRGPQASNGQVKK
ncbi:MAG TPA: Hsp20 family protein [Devosia sp.]|nr:Hsp20 family protein [Devosia sp.]